MAIFRRLIYAALCAGVLSGIFAAGAHQIGTVPLILEAEAYEEAAQHATADKHEGAAAHEHATAEWEPENGVERAAYTLVADLLAAIGFALLLAAGLTLRGGAVTWRDGLFWGLAGFATFLLLRGPKDADEDESRMQIPGDINVVDRDQADFADGELAANGFTDLALEQLAHPLHS